MIYKRLQHFENTGGKFLFNFYIPKTYNRKTEIDVLLICSKGLFAFESKNFGGWIFGDEAHQNWTQVLPKGRGRSHKEHFYNPILQNAGHIRYLKKVVGQNISAHSVIVFSNRCTLKEVTVNLSGVIVAYLRNVATAVDQMCSQIQGNFLTKTEIDNIYSKLYPYTQISYEEARQHIENLQKI